ncbi:MAG TPA: EAL domain-containing protein [Paraburkholderia sp.]|uniref:sensor domain-containing protein n=1 Tax=Paraburkholderia sp. TaxID=1926495 RepID=UPI002B487E1C|nr:EAL domain-containing protein [Paraburkholderia sp.]HKR40414.1 EAL domain-containing protein [Paraburkholderia sp.]
MTFDIEQWTQQFLDLARKMDAVAAELHAREQNGPGGCLRALSLRLRNLSSVAAAYISSEIARHIRIQDALTVSEGHFRTLAENLPAYLARHTPDARSAYRNRALETLLGGAASELRDRSLGEIYSDGRFDAYESAIREVARTGSEKRLDLSVVTVDRQQRLHHVHLVPEHDEKGAVTSVLTIGFDITMQRRSEEQQQAQYETILELNNRLEEKARLLGEARVGLQSVLQTLPDMVWLKDAEGVYLSCNHAFERMIGRREREILGKTDHYLFDAELADVFREKDKAAIEAGAILISEEWVSYPESGTRALLETRKVPVFDAEGKLTGVLGIARDITERKRIEEMLASRERQYRTLVEHSPDTVARYGKDLRLLYANPTFNALAAGGIDASIGRKPSESQGGASAILYEQNLVKVFADGNELQFELEWARKGDVRQCTLIRLTPERGADGTVETVLAVGRDITELCTSREKIRRMAYYDPLTSLPNRTSFNKRLRRTFGSGSAHCHAGAVMMIDLDRFKGVNDTLGHAMGDELLREAAERLGNSVRSCDTVARLGGDEFAVLLPELGRRSVLEEIARDIIDRFDDRFMLSSKEVFVSCSIGIALYPSDSLQADDLLKYADSAMYLAKRAGRRCFRFYSKELTVDAAARLTLESELRRAVKRGELELHYQPKVLLEDHEVTGSEALLRWRRPDVGLVAPNEFIPVAEETGLIIELGEWALREACRTAAEWNNAETTQHTIAVNLSARQFQSRNLAGVVEQILAETGCRPEWLELEITESLLLAEDDSVLNTLSTFRSMGLSIAIDDFGTGYSSLSYLARFPIDTLKIDRSFVQKVTMDPRHAELVKAILSIARCLGQEVVAEGVETVEQAAFLRANGCQSAQGFLYSKPLPKRDITLLPTCLGAGVQNTSSCSKRSVLVQVSN